MGEVRLCPPSLQAVHAMGVVNFARLVEDDALLPAAYLACSEFEEQIAHFFTREDGCWEQLSEEDVGKCFHAKGILVTACYVNARLVYDPTPSRYYPRGTRCGEELQAMLGGFLSGIATLAWGNLLRGTLRGAFVGRVTGWCGSARRRSASRLGNASPLC